MDCAGNCSGCIDIHCSDHDEIAVLAGMEIYFHLHRLGFLNIIVSDIEDMTNLHDSFSPYDISGKMFMKHGARFHDI